MLFKGYTHSKRGRGLTSIPENLVKAEPEMNVKKEINKLFTYYFLKKGDVISASEKL
jgi:hypothetical protein